MRNDGEYFLDLKTRNLWSIKKMLPYPVIGIESELGLLTLLTSVFFPEYVMERREVNWTRAQPQKMYKTNLFNRVRFYFTMNSNGSWKKTSQT